MINNPFGDELVVVLIQSVVCILGEKIYWKENLHDFTYWLARYRTIGTHAVWCGYLAPKIW
jgi:hypothetical protein